MSIQDMSNKPICNPDHEKFYATQFPWQTMSVEEYAARHSHTIGAFSLDSYSFSDQRFDAWMTQLGAILRDTDRARQCRRTFLTPDECTKIERLLDGLARGDVDL
jgi:hypothetical protein